MSNKNPLTAHYNDKFEKQYQEYPGIQSEMHPVPDTGETSYQGTGKLVGKKALVTGGDSGIGRAAVIAYAKEGADVAINYHPDEEKDAQDVKAAVEKEGRKCVLLPGDLRNPPVAKESVQKAVQDLGGLDILVLNAGMQQSQKNIQEISDKQLRDTFEVNVFAGVRIVQEALPHLKAGSKIIFTASIQSFHPSTHLKDYAMTKSCNVSLTKSLAAELGEQGICVNAVAPGPIWTPLQICGGQPQEKIPSFGQNEPLGRAGQPVELAPVYVLLASDESTYVTGQVIGVTGGAPIN